MKFYFPSYDFNTLVSLAFLLIFHGLWGNTNHYSAIVQLFCNKFNSVLILQFLYLLNWLKHLLDSR